MSETKNNEKEIKDALSAQEQSDGSGVLNEDPGVQVQFPEGEAKEQETVESMKKTVEQKERELA